MTDPAGPTSVAVSRDASVNPSIRSSAREREVFRLLEPWRQISSHLFRPVSFRPGSQRPTPVGCHDTALSAFAQLGAFRLSVQRCMIVLFGRGHEYVLAESTQTLSLQSDDVHGLADGLWIGTASFSSDEGLSNHLLSQWSAEHAPRENVAGDFYHTQGLTSSYFIVNDMRQHKAHQQVLSAFNSRIRFLAAIPVRSHRGFPVGAYIVMDDVPRYGLSESELLFLEDMSRTVLNHLSATRAAAQKKNAERLIKGLSVFTQGGCSLRDWWYEEYDAQQQRNRKQDKNAPFEHEARERRANEDLGDKIAEPTHDLPSGVIAPTETIGREVSSTTRLQDSQIHDFAAEPAPALRFKPESTHPGEISQDRFDLEASTSLVFSRASNLIREAMDADGVLFLDAGFTQTRNRAASDGRRFSNTNEALETSSTSEPSGPSAEGTSNASSGGEAGPCHSPTTERRRRRTKRRRMKCEPLAYCTRVKSSINAQHVPHSYTTFSQRRMEKLLDRYPSGKVFNFSEDGCFETSSGHEESELGHSSASRGRSVGSSSMTFGEADANAILDICAGARSVAFLPLWDAHREKWRSGAFIWTTTPGKYFSRDEDLAYLLAFADSVTGSMTRLDMLAADQAKFTFISTISHELRSPLHGVLAGSEYLLSTRLTQIQQEMAMTVKIAAGSLLDTINAILDFTKINATLKADRLSKGPQAARSGTSARYESEGSDEDGTVDIAELTEDVVSTVVAGHYHLVSPKSNGANLSLDRQAVQVILDIADHLEYTIRLSSGTWTRILTNLISNALKYTRDGYVHVKLGAHHDQLSLAIQDTGAGISEEYQRHYLFTAFQQEDPLVSGTGLGLYIVKQLVTELGGNIAVESSTQAKNKGTKILITIPGMTTQHDQAQTVSKLLDFEGPASRITLLTRSPLWDNSPRDKVRSTRSSMLKSSIQRTCRDWLHASFQNIERIEDAESADLCLMLESEFVEWWEKVGKELSRTKRLPHLTILAERYGRVVSQLSIDDLAEHCTFIDPPFGPRKLARVLEQALRGQTPAASPLPSLAKRRFPERDRTTDDEGREEGEGEEEGEEAGKQKEKADGAQTADGNGKAGGKRRVLLVEDNDLNMRLLVAWSRRLGVSYVEAVNGLEAVQAYTADPLSFDLVIMDISMPIMDGFTATSEMRSLERRRKLRSCRIVALTGVASDDARATAAKAGIDDFIVKPASLAKLRHLFETGDGRP